jgi:hypothetical protein
VYSCGSIYRRLGTSATREAFVERHRLRNGGWPDPDCISHEVLEGSKGAIAERDMWSSRSSRVEGNEQYARTTIAVNMQRIIATHVNFFGVPVVFEEGDLQGLE